MARNILFVMYDQLRWDYLSCSGHPRLSTPNFDRVAARGVRFTDAYVQSPVCGASRMSTYTGRYVHSHGAAGNNYPLRVGELTLGDHLRALGMGCWLIGKTHMAADAEGMARLGLAPDSVIGARQAECGFDVVVRDDGLWAVGPDGPYDPRPSPYNAHLRAKGYPGENPWADFANAGADGEELASGWFMKNAGRPANLPAEDSETAWLTSRAIEFIDEARGPWLAHVSYIKPHWPYIAPAPYHALYGPEDVLAANRDAGERADPHPVYAAFMDTPAARAFARDEVRDTVIPAYMGLVAQCDAELGRLLDHLEATGRARDTVIVLTSDHGDYLGDHWLGEKDLFHDCSVKVPLIIADPSPEADATRGTTCDALVEAIDLAPTFVEMAGGAVPGHVLEGRSLLPLLRGERPADWRRVAVSEYAYGHTPIRTRLGVAARDARLVMVADRRWKMVHAEGGFRPMLFDRAADPEERVDLGARADHAGVVEEMYGHLNAWARRESQRVTMPDAALDRRAAGDPHGTGVLIGVWDEAELPPKATAAYRGLVPRRGGGT